MAVTRRITRSMTTVTVQPKNNDSQKVTKPRSKAASASANKTTTTTTITKISAQRKPDKSPAPSKTKKTRALAKVGISKRPFPSILATRFGLIQEDIADNLYLIVVQAMLWNQTTGRQARPVFNKLVARYPDPAALAAADLADLTALLQPIGLHNIRAKRCIALGKVWLESPPAAGRRYRRKGYPLRLTDEDSGAGKGADGEDGWEIAHLPGAGPYALDSFRIFHRDVLRGLAADWTGKGALVEGFEPEWKRVLPTDKELKVHLRWMWLKEGVVWSDVDGSRAPADKETIRLARLAPEERLQASRGLGTE